MTIPTSMKLNYSNAVPVSQNYAPVVPPVAEAVSVPIPVTKQAAQEIVDSNPLGKIISFINEFANKSYAPPPPQTAPDFNALLGALSQYLIAASNNNNRSAATTAPQVQSSVAIPQKKSWLSRVNDYFNSTPEEKAAAAQSSNAAPQKPLLTRVNDYFNGTPEEKAMEEIATAEPPKAKTAIERGQYLTAAAPLIGKIADAFVDGSGTLVRDGLLSLGRRIGWGWKRGGKLKKKKKSVYVIDKTTGEKKFLGKKASLSDDVGSIAKSAFKKALELGSKNKYVSKILEHEKKNGWLSKIADVFSYVVTLIKPEWGATANTVTHLLKKADKKIKGSGMRGGKRRSPLNGFKSQKEKMAWVRSFRGKGTGAGYKRKRRNAKRMLGLSVNTRLKGFAGSGRRRRHKHRKYRGGSKSSVYSSYAIKYPKKHKHKKYRGGSMVSSGFLGIGDPRNPSGWFGSR